jgi:hypothetical protein
VFLVAFLSADLSLGAAVSFAAPGILVLRYPMKAVLRNSGNLFADGL